MAAQCLQAQVALLRPWLPEAMRLWKKAGARRTPLRICWASYWQQEPTGSNVRTIRHKGFQHSS